MGSSVPVVLQEKWKVDDTTVNGSLCLLCGGAKCPKEDWTKQENGPSAIRGLNSSWITDELVAMQRPSSRLLSEFKIIDQFHAARIGAVICLEESGMF